MSDTFPRRVLKQLSGCITSVTYEGGATFAGGGHSINSWRVRCRLPGAPIDGRKDRQYWVVATYTKARGKRSGYTRWEVQSRA